MAKKRPSKKAPAKISFEQVIKDRLSVTWDAISGLTARVDDLEREVTKAQPHPLCCDYCVENAVIYLVAYAIDETDFESPLDKTHLCASHAATTVFKAIGDQPEASWYFSADRS